ncbi:uncharacterized protein LOC114365328 [Ostrinia furnacalis]|uniref:uncharacterized protein LOC114365328 n=1 Tax=Ostrinia furnacalis TaxID=93504 RepID=UPI00103D56B7|nr:uncharacterized protein LOC114365328 [Ostrinia furnacalis]
MADACCPDTMDAKGKERGILKLEPRPRIVVEARSELTPQGSCEHAPVSPQPSVDRLSVTWADPGSMTSSGVNLFHLPSDTPLSNEVKFSPTAGGESSISARIRCFIKAYKPLKSVTSLFTIPSQKLYLA